MIRKFFVGLSLALSALAVPTYAATATVTPATTYQTIDGFGGGAVYYTGWLLACSTSVQTKILDTMFTGLGLSYLRIANWNQDSTTSLTADSFIVAEGRKRIGKRFKILMSSWSAPGYLKGSGSKNGSHDSTYKNASGKDTTVSVMYKTSLNTLKKSNGKFVYADFGHWWKRSLVRYADKGIYPDVISLQNEPDMNASYEETLFAKTENDTIAGYPEALKAVHDSVSTLGSVPQIYGPEVLGIGYNEFQSYADNMDMNLVDGFNYHLYHGNKGLYDDPGGYNAILKTLTTSYTGKHWMMSEFCPMRGTHPSSDMLALAELMYHLVAVGNVSSYINWELLWGDGGQMVEIDNPWSVKTWRVNPEYHAMRQFSRFTGPGWYRVAARSDDTTVHVVAFKSSDGDSLTLVAVNRTALAKTLNFSPTGYAAVSSIWQSQVNGAMSSKLASTTTTASVSLPDSSVTTIVFLNTSGTSSSSSAVAQTAYSSAAQIPGTIQAENYDWGGDGVAYYDSDAANSGGVYRDDNVDITGDATSGYVLGWTMAGEWLEYTVDVAATDTYSWKARVSSSLDGSAFHMSIDDVDVTETINVENTGSWNVYATMEGTTTAQLTKGPHTLRVTVDGAYFNLDWIAFAATSTRTGLGLDLVADESDRDFVVLDARGRSQGLLRLGSHDDLSGSWILFSSRIPSGVYLLRPTRAGQSSLRLVK